MILHPNARPLDGPGRTAPAPGAFLRALLRTSAALALGVALAGSALAPGARAATPSGVPAAALAPSPIDVNTATVSELTALPGIGEKRARAIVEAREQRGGFKTVDELVEVRGIGPANLEKLRPYVRIGSGGDR
jgi:competence ComEA-like helix-hairpin-helix protein